jgi:hypothetical protein
MPAPPRTTVAPRGPNIWVVRRRAGFSITEEGGRRALIRPLTQRTAVAIARRIAQAYGSELIIQGTTGRIRARDSQGADPITRKG